MNAKIIPTHVPIPKSPAFGKYNVRYPIKPLVIDVIIKIELIRGFGTPGKKIIKLYRNMNKKNAATAPTNNKVILYKYNPRTIKIIPNIKHIKKNVNWLLLKNSQIVVKSIWGHPLRPVSIWNKYVW